MPSTRKSLKSSIETATSESLSAPRRKSDQLELLLLPVPADAEKQVMELLFALARQGNITAAKLFLDNYRPQSRSDSQLATEDALKLLHETRE